MSGFDEGDVVVITDSRIDSPDTLIRGKQRLHERYDAFKKQGTRFVVMGVEYRRNSRDKTPEFLRVRSLEEIIDIDGMPFKEERIFGWRFQKVQLQDPIEEVQEILI